MIRSLTVRPVRALLVCLALLVGPGCSSITVTRTSAPDLKQAWRNSVVRHCRLSPRTEQTLREFDLIGIYDSNPEEAISQLHAIASKEPHPDVLFALAEASYLQGHKLESWQSREAIGHYYLCAGYAYHYLLATADPNPELDPSTIRQSRLLAPRNAFDPRFRLACDLYNQSLSKCIAAAQRVGRLDARRQLHLPTPDGQGFTLSVVHHGFRWKPEEFGPVVCCNDYRVKGLDNHHETYGLGVPLIVERAEVPVWPEGTRYPPKVSFPATAFFRFDGSLADLKVRRNGQLELYNPMAYQGIQVQGRMVPLQTDLTTPLAYLLAGTDLAMASYGGFLRPDDLKGLTGVYMLEPYQPDKIPVVLVHGLLSSPLTWAPLFNDLQADPKLRENYQFWFYLYPTANPVLTSAADLRQDLVDLRRRVDPENKNRSFNQMVLIGHSMGGLLSRMLTVDSGDSFWQQVSDKPFREVKLEPEAEQELRRTMFFDRDQSVSRVIFLATPHRGSRLSPSPLGKLAGDLARLPSKLMKVAKDLSDDKDLRIKTIPNSVEQLAPESPILQVLASRPRPENVRYHSIVGVLPPGEARLERWITGTSNEEGDSVVSYRSAHLDGVESEKILPADHMHVHQHPLAVMEVRRILLEHLQASNPIRLLKHAETSP